MSYGERIQLEWMKHDWYEKVSAVTKKVEFSKKKKKKKKIVRKSLCLMILHADWMLFYNRCIF